MMMKKSKSLSLERKFKICRKYGFDLSQVRMNSLTKSKITSVKEKNV